jgi:hypothetical protein
VARRMFHDLTDLTDRLGQAAIALAVPHEAQPPLLLRHLGWRDVCAARGLAGASRSP